MVHGVHLKEFWGMIIYLDKKIKGRLCAYI